MAWITLTEADVLTVLTGDELEGFREAALADGQADPVEPTLGDVVEEVRGYIAACPRNVLGPTGTIPSRLKASALALLAVRIPGRAGKTPKEVRKTAAEEAVKRLEQVAACRFDIGETPEPTTEEPSPAPSPSFSGRTRHSTRSERAGL